MDLEAARVLVQPEAIFQYVRDHENELLLPDQDVFNSLYGAQTLQIDDALWNYDARYYSGYLLRSGGAYHMDWVMQHTAILHFAASESLGNVPMPRALPLCTNIIGSWRLVPAPALSPSLRRLLTANPRIQQPKKPFPPVESTGGKGFYQDREEISVI